MFGCLDICFWIFMCCYFSKYMFFDNHMVGCTLI
jgi:hypothetical protein